nr:B54 [uncultured bacterium]
MREVVKAYTDVSVIFNSRPDMCRMIEKSVDEIEIPIVGYLFR